MRVNSQFSLDDSAGKVFSAISANLQTKSKKFLSLHNVTIEVVEDFAQLNLAGVKGIGRILRRHRPDILHLYFTSFLGVYPWLAKVCNVKQVCFTDQTSRPAVTLLNALHGGKELRLDLLISRWTTSCALVTTADAALISWECCQANVIS
jgi:hypothetical protein